MTRRVTAAILAGLVLAVVGCDTDPPPVAPAKKIEDNAVKPLELKPPVKPAVSEPAAAQWLKEAVDAHTGGQPERLAPFKTCSYTRGGFTDTPGGRSPSTWQFDLQWPERYRLRSESQIGSEGAAVTRYVSFAVTPDGGWQAFAEVQAGQRQEKRERTPLDAGAVRTLKSQMHEDAMLFLFPLADPKTVAARGPDEAVNGRELVGLHVWTPALDYALLSFDKKTKLLVRMVYHGREALTDQTKEVVVLDYQEVGGVKLAAKLYVKANGLSKADWNKLDVTPVASFDPKLFDKP